MRTYSKAHFIAIWKVYPEVCIISSLLTTYVVATCWQIWADEGWEWKVFSFSCHLLTTCTASLGPINLSDGMNCAQASDEEMGLCFSWLERRRKQMIQLIINRSLCKSKPFWQLMTKKNTEPPASLRHLFIAHSQQLLSGRLPPVQSTRCLNRLFKYFHCWFFPSFSILRWVSVEECRVFDSPAYQHGFNESWLWSRRGIWC